MKLNQKGKVSATLIFTIAVVALATYVFFFEYKKGEKTEEKKQADAKVFSGIEESKVKSLHVSPNLMNHEFDIRAEKKDGKWQLLTPINDVADNDAIETFIHSLLEEKTHDVLQGDQVGDLKTYGLDHPKGSVALANDTGEETQVNVGTIKAYDGSAYVTISNKPGVSIVSATWNAYTDKKPNDFRFKKVERSHFTDWTAVSTKVLGHPQLNLKKVDGEWQSIPKSEIPLQLNLVEGFIYQMANLEILDFVSETKVDLKKYSLVSPVAQVRISGDEKDKKPHDFQLSLSEHSPDKKPEHATATSSELTGVVEVYSAIIDVAKRGTQYFFNRKFPFQYDPTQAAKVEIKTAGLNMKFEKTDPSQWAKVEELTKALSRMEATNYLNEKGSGLAPAKNQIEVFNEKGETLLRLVWGGEYKPKVNDPANVGIKFVYAQTNKVPKYTLALKESAIEELALQSLKKETPKPSATKEAHQ